MNIIYRNPKLYFISGKAKHGKTTIGNIVKEEYEKKGQKAIVMQFASPMKDYLHSYFGWDGKEETKPRELLQALVTEVIRISLNKPRFFINRMIEDIEILSYFFDVIIIDDLRLKIEIEAMKERFRNSCYIRITRNNFDNGLTEEEKKHQTEIDLDDYNGFNYYIYNDGNIDSLKKQVMDIINKEEQNENNDR